MAHPTYDAIIRDCIAEALCLPRDPISEELLGLALSAMNEQAEIIWLSWKWDNEKLDEFVTPTVDANGIIVFAEDVESVMAVKQIDASTDEGTFLWPQDEYLAAVRGETISTERFQQLGIDTTAATAAQHYRRIRVEAPLDPTDPPSYKALCLKKCVRAVVDGAYDVTDPTATPTDYRVMTFLLDRAETSLRSAVKDTLRRSQGIPTEGQSGTLLNLALKRETFDSGRERRVEPKSPMFSDVGNWDG